MDYTTSDDIVLKGPNSYTNNSKGKKGKGILILFLLIIILGGTAAGYWYYMNYIRQTPKDIFFKYVGQNNISNVLNLDTYYEMINKANKQSFLSETTANFTTTMENDLIKDIDVSKFNVSLNIQSNKTSNKSLLDAKIAYSSNDLFNVKLLNTKDSIGIASDEIFDKYIASSKEELNSSISKSSGKDTNLSSDILDETLNSISNNQIKMDENLKKQKAKEYLDVIYNLVPEESVSEKENVVVTIDSETINTNAYTLNLETDKYKEISKALLEKIKNDETLLNEIVTGEEETVLEQENTNSINTITNIQTQTEYVEGETEIHQTEMTVGESDDMQLEITDEPETVLVDQTTLDTTKVPAIELDETNDELNDEGDLYVDLLRALVLGQKINGTVDALKDKIDTEISNISSIKEGVSITAYVRNEENKNKETIKVVSELREGTSLDIEYSSNTKFKITYLAPEKDESGKEVSKGGSIAVEKNSTDVNEKYNIQYNEIENKKVVSKIQIDLETNTANSSKGYTNNVIMKYNNKDGDLKVNIKNEIKFEENAISEEITEENAVFLDRLSNEEAHNLYLQLSEKFSSVYEEKIQNLSFIDNNSSNSVVQQPVAEQINKEEKEQIKNKLIEKVSNMMGEAQQRGENFTIQNLVDLSIEGYTVSSIVSEDLAVIKINGYTFNIDKDFMLSEE